MEDLQSWTVHGRDPITSSTEISLSFTAAIPGAFTLITICLNENTIQKYKRTYPKLQTVVANIVGIVKFIMTVSHFIVTYITSQMLHVELSNVCISIGETQHQKMKKKIASHIPLSENSPVKSYELRTGQATSRNLNQKRASLSFIDSALLSICVKRQSV
jgi:hypothetical protein